MEVAVVKHHNHFGELSRVVDPFAFSPAVITRNGNPLAAFRDFPAGFAREPTGPKNFVALAKLIVITQVWVVVRSSRR